MVIIIITTRYTMQGGAQASNQSFKFYTAQVNGQEAIFLDTWGTQCVTPGEPPKR